MRQHFQIQGGPRPPDAVSPSAVLFPSPNLQSSIFNLQSSSGQAILEFLIGIVAFLALTAGLLQLVLIANAHLDAMNEARQDAGRLALLPLLSPDTPDYIRQWNAGDDDRTYSRDDAFNHANAQSFRDIYTEQMAGATADWAVMGAIPGNPIDDLRSAPEPVNAFGLVSASETRDVPLLPAVRHLLYRADQIDIESKVWMTSTYGIY